MKNIILPSYSFFRNESTQVFFKGFLWYQTKLYQNPEELLAFLQKNNCLDSLDACKSIFKNVSGSFSILCYQELKGMYIISDIIRTYPLFYNFSNNRISVSENINHLDNLEIDESKLAAFITSGYVFGNQTIYNQTNGIQAGEIIHYDSVLGIKNTDRYFEFIPNDDAAKMETKVFVNDFNERSNLVFSKMIGSAIQCKNWVVPLSGGHDSRQIINSLLKLGVKNVVTFTYGKQGNPQAKISQEVAQKAGYEWHFVEYTEDKWKHLHDLGLIDEYLDFAFQGVSTPHLQDFLAVYELKEKGVIGNGDVFVPGHTLDMISGGHFSELDINCKTKQDSLLRTSKRHSKLYENKSVLKANFFDNLSEIYDEAKLKPQFFQEYFNWQERQAKFIVNSCRAYEFFGFDYRLPFWDRQLVDLFLSLPPEQRMNRLFFKEMERNGILLPILANIPFEDEIVLKQPKNSLTTKIKKIIPDNIKALLVSAFANKQYEAESLNQIYALKAKNVASLLGSISEFPKSTHDFLRLHYIRPTHRVDYHLLSGLYAVRLNVNKLKK